MQILFIPALFAVIFLAEEVIARAARSWYHTHGFVLRRVSAAVQSDLGPPTPLELPFQFRHRLSPLETVKVWPIAPSLFAFQYAYPIDTISGYFRLDSAPQRVVVCAHLDVVSIVFLPLLGVFLVLAGWSLAIAPAVVLAALSLARRRQRVLKLATLLRSVWEAPMPATPAS